MSASEVVVVGATGTMANGFEKNESNKESSKSISALPEVVGASDQKDTKA